MIIFEVISKTTKKKENKIEVEGTVYRIATAGNEL